MESNVITKVTRNVLGARGIDRISITENSATTHGYPLYDGHGNCRAILTRDGTDDYATGNWRTYDVWGSVRSGSATGDPKSRYVASIGHVADDESSLIYMRARYYEPATGRFLSEDPAMDGNNWYVYCHSNPINLSDPSGQAAWNVLQAFMFSAGLFIGNAIGFYIVTAIFMSAHRTYRMSSLHFWALNLANAGATLLSFAGGVWASADRDLLFKSPGDIAQSLKKSLAQTKWARHTMAFGAGLLVGLIIGAFTAIITYLLSDSYQNSHWEGE